jgi:hypothetical protein
VRLAVKLEGNADRLEWRVYSSALVLVHVQAREGAFRAGWQSVEFDDPSISSGTYYFTLTAQRSAQTGFRSKAHKWTLLR